MLSSSEFDLWANDYDKSVNVCEESGEYPFAGYKNVLNNIYRRIRKVDCAKVLDIGFGTGVLTTKLYNAGCKITGIDFSDKMIEIAKEKMPNAELIKWDFSNGLPDEIKNKKFDFIISTYAIHHVSDKMKVEILNELGTLLNISGEILIGDVSFSTRGELENCKIKSGDRWDYDEFYIVFDEIKKTLKPGLICDFTKISHCSGVLSIKSR